MQASLEEMATVAHVVDVGDENETDDASTPEPFGLLNANICERDQIESIASKCRVTLANVENAYPCSSMQESLVALSDESSNLSVRQLVYRSVNLQFILSILYPERPRDPASELSEPVWFPISKKLTCTFPLMHAEILDQFCLTRLKTISWQDLGPQQRTSVRKKPLKMGENADHTGPYHPEIYSKATT